MRSFVDLYCRRALAVLVTTGVAAAAAGPAQTGLGLAPMRVEFNLAPGAVHSATLTLANNGGQPVRVVGETLDFYVDSTATPQFGPGFPQEAEFSCRSWLLANPMELELNGGAQTPVRYTLRVPQAALPRSYHCALGFTTEPTAEEAQAVGLRTAVQIVAAIYVVVGTPAAEGSIRDLKLEYAPDPNASGWRAVVTIQNTGVMHFRPQGELAVLDESGAVVETVPFVSLPVLPKRDQNFVFPLKLRPGGKYKLRARVDLGGAEIQEATANVVATKP